MRIPEHEGGQMKNSNPVIYAVLSVFLAATLPATSIASDDNLLTNPGFEEKIAADQGGWEMFETSWVADDVARSGDRSMFNGAHSRTVAYPPYFVGTVSGSFQELPASAGSRWRLTGYGMPSAELDGSPAFGIVQVSFFDSDGKDLGTVETAGSTSGKAKLSNEVNSDTPAGDWTFLDAGVATAPEGTATIQAFTLYVDFSGSNVPQGVYFDDLTLCALEAGEDSGCGQ